MRHGLVPCPVPGNYRSNLPTHERELLAVLDGTVVPGLDQDGWVVSYLAVGKVRGRKAAEAFEEWVFRVE